MITTLPLSTCVQRIRILTPAHSALTNVFVQVVKAADVAGHRRVGHDARHGSRARVACRKTIAVARTLLVLHAGTQRLQGLPVCLQHPVWSGFHILTFSFFQNIYFLEAINFWLILYTTLQ